MTTSNFNLSGIDTPADLKAQNDQVKQPLEVAMEAMSEVGFQGSMLLVLWLLGNMAEWHQDVALDKAEGRKAVAAWAYDHGKVEAAMAVLRTIDIGLNDDEEDDEDA